MCLVLLDPVTGRPQFPYPPSPDLSHAMFHDSISRLSSFGFHPDDIDQIILASAKCRWQLAKETFLFAMVLSW